MGAAYSLAMPEACVHVGPVQDRMPLILRPDQTEQWPSSSPDEVMALCRPYEGLMTLDRTEEPWVARKPGA